MDADTLMQQIQAYARAWSLSGSPFDNGRFTEEAEQEKAKLKRMIQEALGAPAVENGLTTIPCAVGLDKALDHYGFLFIPDCSNQWSTATRLPPHDIEKLNCYVRKRE